MSISKSINFDFKKFQERQESWRYKLWRWWIYTKVGSWWTDFTNGVKQLMAWRKVIYNTHPYDYNDVYTLIGFKLKTLGDTMERNQLVVGWEHDVKWIRVCQRLCDKLETEFYKMEYFDFVDNKYGFLPTKTDDNGEILYSMETTNLRDDLNHYFNANKLSKKKVTVEITTPNSGWVEGSERNREFLAGRIGDYKHNKARKLLFKILEQKIEYWWD